MGRITLGGTMRKLIPSVLIVAIAVFLLSYNATGETGKEQSDNGKVENGKVELRVYNFDDYFNYLTEIEIKGLEIKNEVDVLSVEEVKYETYEITAYTSGYESTGKKPSHPQYGITASGERVKENYTIACPRSMDFGTEIYIPYFDNVFVCKDRGGAITGNRIDVYIEDLSEALEFGRQDLDVQILEQGEEE